jgi:predicted nucleic acid-binding protein
MYLVDTSVWIDFIRGNSTAVVNHLRHLFEIQATVGISSLIYQEVLQGSDSQQRFESFKNYLNELPFYEPKNPKESYAQAAHIYFSCRRKGITIRSTIDCLIAQIAIEHELILLHNDNDFIQLAKVFPQLKLWQGIH